MISEGDHVLLYLDERRSWLVRVEAGREFHTHKGLLRLEDLIGKPFGTKVKTALGQSIYVFKPTIDDHVARMQRPTQILYYKDIAIVLLRLGLHCGSTVIEAGTGSGAMTVALAEAVRPEGHVYTYDIRSDLIEVARRNILRVGLEKYVTMRNMDARMGFEEKGVDAVFLDLSEPWDVVEAAHSALSPGLPIASFSPTINQVEKMVTALKAKGFVAIQSIECFVRELRVEAGKTRPRSMMVAHTGYLTFARKVLE
ncbi:MAG: tRNA (adenine-N1)-methyltransferase [archaeon]